MVPRLRLYFVECVMGEAKLKVKIGGEVLSLLQG
jgi:hypothetical protein